MPTNARGENDMKTKCTCELYDENLGHEENCMATETKRTPTPWKVAEKDVNGLTRIQTAMEGVHAGDALIGRIHDKADAAFIVRAVNAHEELLEALKDALTFIQDVENTNGNMLPNRNLEPSIKQAIARAQEPKP